MKNKVFVGTVPFPKLLLHGGEAAITCGCAVRRWLSGTQTRPTTPEVHMGAGSFLGTVQTSGSTCHPINPPLGSSGSVPPSPSEGKEVITIKPKQYGKGRCLSCCRSRRGKGARGPQSPCVHTPRVEWCLWAGSDCLHAWPGEVGGGRHLSHWCVGFFPASWSRRQGPPAEPPRL